MILQLIMACFIMALLFITVNDNAEPQVSGDSLRKVDHLVYATPDLNRGIDELERLIGVRASAGGQHPGQGTRNALLALGATSYLEIIAPDPEQPRPAFPRPFGIDSLTQSKLVAWAAKDSNLENLTSVAAREGVELGPVVPGSRRRPDGIVLSWRITSPRMTLGDGIVPFFIDWGQSPHPAATAARGLTLIELRAEHPDPDRVRDLLRKLGLALPVKQGARPALVAVIEGPRGRVELR
jgi:Glyoxalase-like domain